VNSQSFAFRAQHLIAGLLLLIVGASCGQLPRTNPNDERPCAPQADNDYWTEFGFSATVSKPPQCPVPLDTPNQHEDFTANITLPDSMINTLSLASLDILNANGAKVASGAETYTFGYNWDVFNHIYSAHIDTYYTAGSITEPTCNDLPYTPPCADTAIFRTHVTAAAGYNPFSSDVKGGVGLPYTQAIDASANVSAPSPNVPLQASAFAYNGADPLSYYWTLNGSHVGSNSDTYALQNPIADMTYTIKVRITDAEGDTGSAVQSVTIPSCDPTKLIC